MKPKNIFCRAAAIVVLSALLPAAHAAEIVYPANGAEGVMPNEKLTVSYPDAVNADEKTVEIGGAVIARDRIAADGNTLTVDLRDTDYGGRYKTVIKNAGGDTELVTFFNTGFPETSALIAFGKGNMDKLWNGKCSQGASAAADSDKLEMTSTTSGSVGGRINTTEFDLNAADANRITLTASSEKAVQLKIYFSKTGGNKGFTGNLGTLDIVRGFNEYSIPLSDIPDWDGEIKQFLIEQTTKEDNTVTFGSFEIQSLNKDETRIGEFDLYKDYGTESEEKITGTAAAPGTVTASVAAVQSVREKNILLIIARYRDGVMTGAKCIGADISDGALRSAITVSTETCEGETVKAFLRRGSADIRPLKECISAEIE